MMEPESETGKGVTLATRALVSLLPAPCPRDPPMDHEKYSSKLSCTAGGLTCAPADHCPC